MHIRYLDCLIITFQTQNLSGENIALFSNMINWSSSIVPKFKQEGPEAAARLPVVHACHQVQASASEAGSREGLPADGGGVCGGSRAFEAAER